MEKLVLIDGNSVAYRAFFALPLLSNRSGLHTNAVYGFTTMLLRLLEEENPTHFLVAFDAGKETFRHEQYAEYKGGREKTPPELSEQFPLLKELLSAFGIAQFELDGYEADDIIGTLTRIAEEQKMRTLVVTGDKDMLQLASEHVTVALTRKGISEVERFDPPAIAEKYGLRPEQIVDLKGLMGDSSDNIPGVPGVGEKTALKLLHQYDSVEETIRRAEAGEIKGKLGERLREHAADAMMSKQLAAIFREVPQTPAWETIAYSGYNRSTLAAAFQKLEFKSLLDKLELHGEQAGEARNLYPPVEVRFLTADDADELADRLTKLSAGGPEEAAAVYVETAGDNPHTAEVLGVAFFGKELCCYLPFAELRKEKAEAVRRWLADPDMAKTMYDSHRAAVALGWKGIPLSGCAFDVQLAAYLLDPTGADNSLHALAKAYAVPGPEDDHAVYGKGAKFHVPEERKLGEHLARKAEAVYRIAPLQRKDLDDKEMHRLYYDLELPLSRVLTQMELRGIRVNEGVLEGIGEEIAGQLERLVAAIYELAGGEFNINSTKQLGEVLFEKLKLPVVKKTKTGYSTDAEVLEKLEPEHEIIGHLLHYRTLSKLQSTYIEGLRKEIRPETGKIHTYFQQTIAATGRLSSQFPNLQNIPIRLEEGRKIRKAFVPSEPDWLMLAADYSQIELRVLAHISQDERLIEAFRQGMDIHTKTAMDVFGVAESEVDANMRRQAKAVNFGIVYGISGYGLAQNLGISRPEAERFIAQYFAVFRGVRRYMDEIVLKARKDGFVTTLLARRRYLPEIGASNYNLRSFAERTAMNTPIQGTAADIIKLAMVRLDERLKEEGLRSRMLLQVHDELVFEVAPDELETMRAIVPEVMEGAMKLDVPLKVEVSWGENWYEAK